VVQAVTLIPFRRFKGIGWSQSMSSAARGKRRPDWLAQALVVAEISLAMGVPSGAGRMLASVGRILAIDPGRFPDFPHSPVLGARFLFCAFPILANPNSGRNPSQNRLRIPEAGCYFPAPVGCPQGKQWTIASELLLRSKREFSIATAPGERQNAAFP
jgi:hypothetical protein